MRDIIHLSRALDGYKIVYNKTTETYLVAILNVRSGTEIKYDDCICGSLCNPYKTCVSDSINSNRVANAPLIIVEEFRSKKTGQVVFVPSWQQVVSADDNYGRIEIGLNQIGMTEKEPSTFDPTYNGHWSNNPNRLDGIRFYFGKCSYPNEQVVSSDGKVRTSFTLTAN